jgi:acyl-CoA synthetase (AMP-forming)/AMP-acid ligase II
MNIAQPFLTRARSHPELKAVTHAGQTVLFGELARRILGLAGSLQQAKKLESGARVLIFMENRREAMEVLLATWAAGFCAVPVNAKLHPKEVKPIANDSGARIIFTSQSLYLGLHQELSGELDACEILSVDDLEYEISIKHAPIACIDKHPDDLAWIFYTSGTTGTPKGAMLSHRNLMTMCLQYCADVDQVLPGQTMLHVAPLSHGSGLYALPHLFGGGHQVIESAFTTDIVFESLHRYPAISMFAAPTMLSRLIRSAQGINNPAGNLLTAYYGGGPMYVSDLLQTLDLFGPKLFQVYGQGESPMTITGLSKRDHEGTRDSRHLERLASCGTARTGVEVRVVNDDEREVANGELGEVITRSDTRMLGYWNNEQATRSTIRDGWLWTGDIGTMDDMGYLTLRDRSKDMIIRGGSNIYPREIEEVLLRHPAIIEVSVIGREHADLGEEPIAFVVTQPGHVVTSDEMDALCLENMARFKRPREYIFSESLPKNNYGKILKTELRKKIKKGVA